MKLIYRLVGYDRTTGKLVEKNAVPEKFVDYAKRVAGIDPRDPNAIGDAPLTDGQARDIAGTIGVNIDVAHKEYFLEAYSEKSLPRQPAHA